MTFSVVEKPIPDQAARGVPDPRVLQLWLDAAQRPPAPAPKTIDDIRAGMGWPNTDLSHGVSTEAITLAGRHGPIAAKVYRPAAPRGAIVYFHGGGFVGGSLNTVENPCKLLAEKSGAAVFSVDYRLAPEHPFPAGLDDAWDAVLAIRFAAEEWGLGRGLAAAGDSVGANLALGCALRGVNEQHPIDAVLLVYPVVDQRPPSEHLPWSEAEYEVNAWPEHVRPALRGSADRRELFAGYYLAGHPASDPLVSPITHPQASDWPPLLVITAEYDYLRLEGEAFARQAAQAGVRVRAVRYRGMDHAFLDKLGLFPQAADAVGEMARFFREAVESTDERLHAQLAFLLEIDKLKLVQRRNELADGSRRENTAEHSWHLVLFAMTLAEHSPGVDVAHAVRLVAVHDLVEIDAGDTFFWDTKGYEDKEQRERAASKRLFGMLPADQAAEFEALWEEFEAAETPEAVFANAVDKLAPVLLNRTSGGRSWRENGITASMIRQKMTIIQKASPRLGEALEALIAEAEASGALGEDS